MQSCGPPGIEFETNFLKAYFLINTKNVLLTLANLMAENGDSLFFRWMHICHKMILCISWHILQAFSRYSVGLVRNKLKWQVIIFYENVALLSCVRVRSSSCHTQVHIIWGNNYNKL